MSSKTKLPKMLLVTGVSPGRGAVGREYLRAACRLLPPESLSVFSFDPEGAQTAVAELAAMRTHLEPPPDESGAAGPGEGRWRWIRHLGERSIERYEIPPLIEKIAAFGRRGEVDRLWVPLHSPTTIRVAGPVAAALGVPLIATVWDPPNYKLRQFGLGRRMRRALSRKFDATVRSAVACGVASDPMRDLYRRLYGTRAVTLILGAPRPGGLAEPTDVGPFRLGFAGNLYAKKEFDALLEALDRNGWKIEDRDVRLELFGDHTTVAAAAPDRIRSHGWLDPAESVRGLSACHATYLPYWFARRRREVVEVSFPGKLALYAAARTPVLFHGPSYSCPVRFLERFPLGRVCATLNPDAIATTLGAMIRDQAWHSRAREACDRAYDAELSATVFRSRFAQLLDVADEDLLPLDAATATQGSPPA